MIAIIDYGAGNIRSLKNALDYLSIENMLTNNVWEIENADAIILPGVGAFPSAMRKLINLDIADTLKKESEKKPFLGICLGMQLLFEESFEFERFGGLSMIPGKIDMISDTSEIIPHMGWNQLVYNRTDCRILEGIGEAYVYFVHSYQAYCSDRNNLAAYCGYGTAEIPAVVTDGKYVFGTQFHPEKSGETGLRILKNFGELI